MLGTERHESRRIDRQLRGRCARQGDPGYTKFLISLEDNLMRLFSNMGAISRILDKTMKEGEPLEHPMLNRSIERAQKTVEGQNYSARKRLLQYDDVLNKQREIIYGIRNDILSTADTRKLVREFVDEEIDERLSVYDENGDSNTDKDSIAMFASWLTSRFPITISADDLTGLSRADMRKKILGEIDELYKMRDELEEPEMLKAIERFVLLRAIDKNWQDHLTEMEDLRKSVGLRSYGQKDPLNEYKSEAFKYFEALMGKIRNDICTGLFRSASSIEVLQAMISRIQEKSAKAETKSAEPPRATRLPK